MALPILLDKIARTGRVGTRSMFGKKHSVAQELQLSPVGFFASWEFL